MNAGIFAMLFVGGGLALMVGGFLFRVREREKALAEILDLPFGERDVRPDTVQEAYSPLVEGTIGLAGKVVEQFDDKGDMRSALERARIPMRSGVDSLGVAAAAMLARTAEGKQDEATGTAVEELPAHGGRNAGKLPTLERLLLGRNLAQELGSLDVKTGGAGEMDLEAGIDADDAEVFDRRLGASVNPMD